MDLLLSPSRVTCKGTYLLDDVASRIVCRHQKSGALLSNGTSLCHPVGMLHTEFVLLLPLNQCALHV